MSLLNKHIVELLTEDQFTTVEVYFQTTAENAVPQEPLARPGAVPAYRGPAPWAPMQPPSFPFIDNALPADLYTYKVSRTVAAELKKGDLVVVPSDQGHRKAKLATVWMVHDKAIINYDAHFSYKWIMAKVDTSDYYSHLEKEQAFLSHLENNEKERQRKEARESMLAAVRPVSPEGLEAFQGALQLLGVNPTVFETPKAAE